MKKLLLIIGLFIITTYSFAAEFKTSLSVDYFYDYTKAIYSSDYIREYNSNGISLSVDTFSENFPVGFFFRGFFGFPFNRISLNDNVSTEIDKNDWTTSYFLAYALGPSFKKEKNNFTFTVSPALTMKWYETSIMNLYYSEEDALLSYGLLIDLNIKYTINKFVYICGGVSPTWYFYSIPIEANSNDGWNNDNIKFLYSVSPRLGVGIKFNERSLFN